MSGPPAGSRIKTIVVWILAVLLPAPGMYYLCGYGKDDRNRSRLQHHIAIIQEQLAGLEGLLHAFARARGRFPTTDEGLKDLPFAWSEPITFEGSSDDRPTGLPFAYTRWLEQTGGALYIPKDIFRSPGGMRALFSDYAPEPGEARVNVPIGADEQGHLFALGPAGVLTPWGTPFGYENRSGFDAGVYSGSPANDPDPRYARQVAPGVFVHSVGAQLYARQYDEEVRVDLLKRGAGGAMLLVALTAVLWLLRRWALVGALAVIAGGTVVGFWFDHGSYATCYLSAPAFTYRDQAMDQRQRELLDGLLARGAISEATHAKAVATLADPAP